MSERYINRHPLRKIVDAETEGNHIVEYLECGHKLARGRREKEAKRRRCPICKEKERP